MADLMALVGSETLLGRELRDYLAGYSLGADLRLIASENEAGGVLSEHAGEPAFVSQLNAGSLIDTDLIVLAGSPESSRKALELAPKQALIDLTYGLEDDPRSRLRAPLVEPHDFRVPPDAIHSIAHPAAVALAMLLGCVVLRYKVSCWIAHVFEPASERGASGVEELQGQAVSLLSFKPMPKKIFDAQLAFSMLAALGEEAALKLDDVETRVERHLATLLERSGDGPMPSLRLVQAPVFHGYSFSIWMQFDADAPDIDQIETLLASENIEVRGNGAEPPNNIGMAGQNGVSVGAITRDRNNARAVWIWAVADNLRLAAQNAVLVAREII